ncbi:MAG TPA: GNAT family N-acetyltransferase [Gemmatimonadales bacterium]|nr:GNAT family N-acetyltransferase [Gemmatimonadales bacterium]
MSAGILIRPLQSDAEAAACARIMAGSEPWLTLGRSYERSLEIVRDPSREVSVALRGDEVVGFVIVCMVGPFPGYIQTVAVAPGMRGEGLGSRLVAHAEARIFRESPNVFLCVSTFNPAARRLYGRLGYREVGELTDYLVRGHGEVLLRKSRGPWSEFATAT